jgi:hypothetical protein
MKKILMFAFFIAIGLVTFAQSLDDVNALLVKQQYAAAKTAIDKYLADPKNASSGEGWYFKGRVYNALSRDAGVVPSDAYEYKVQAFEAFKKYQSLDPKDLRMKLEQYKSYLDLYLGLYDIAAAQFNSKDFTGSYNAFSKAEAIENFILSKKYVYEEIKFNKLDTSLVLNIAASALNAKDTANGVLNYKRIVDAGLTAKDYEPVYEFLVSYYKSKRDATNFQFFLDKAKAAYPQSKYWNELEVSYLTESGDKKAMFAKYEEIYQKEPNNFTNTYNYAVEMYNDIYDRTVPNKDSAQREKLIAILKSALPGDEHNSANMLLTNHLFNIAADYSQAALLIKDSKPPKPADVKKKKELNALSLAKMDETIQYAEKSLKYFQALPELKSSQKVNYRMAASYLVDIYKVKNNAAKSAEYQKLMDSIKF